MKRQKPRIASIGMTDKQAHALKQLLIIYAKHLNHDWQYVGNFDAEETVDTMGSRIDANLRLIDIDSEWGKRVFYFLRALDDENSLVAFTTEPEKADTKMLIKKPLTINISALINLLNGFCF
jgi:hypothetical protein